mmetsp:Transcript_20466/g.38159  ORF Transcript_20466/g.38159 Transcript_20466/m.38159 type:complete len:82 (+) Transcript_20466:101-346(+)
MFCEKSGERNHMKKQQEASHSITLLWKKWRTIHVQLITTVLWKKWKTAHVQLLQHFEKKKTMEEEATLPFPRSADDIMTSN